MLSNLIILLTLFIAAYTDVKTLKVSNKLVLGAFILTITALVLEKRFPEALFNAIPAIIIAAYLWYKKIGGGDIKLLILISFVLSPLTLSIVLISMYLVGAARILFEKTVYKKAETVPLVPGMLIGFILTLIL